MSRLRWQALISQVLYDSWTIDLGSCGEGRAREATLSCGEDGVQMQRQLSPATCERGWLYTVCRAAENYQDHLPPGSVLGTK